MRPAPIPARMNPELIAHGAVADAVGPVVIVSDSLPERNGVGAYHKDLLDQTLAAGYQAALLGPSEDAPTPLKFPLPGDATQRIWLPSPLRFSRVMRELEPTAIVIATPGPYGLLGAWWARRLKAELIIAFHTHFSSVTDLYRNPVLRAFSRLYFGFADSVLFRYGDRVLANSQSMIDLARELGGRNVEFMGTLLPPAALDDPASAPRQSVQRILFAGRLAPEKNLQAYLDAAAALPDLEFVIAGDGPLQPLVAECADRLPNLTYLGWVSRLDLIRTMDRVDLLVLPSHVESFGTVVLEAMARQCLTLVSNHCGILDWPEFADVLYTIEADETVASAIQRVVADEPAALATRAQQARVAACELNARSLSHWFGLLQRANDARRGD